MQHHEFAPPEQLKDAIKCFWHNIRNAGEQALTFEVQPDGYAEIIFYFGDIFSIDANADLQPLPSPFLMGLLNQPVTFKTKGRLEIIGIRCFPWTVFDLLGLPPGKEGVRFFEHPIAKLQPVLNDLIKAGNINQAITQLKQYFINTSAKRGANKVLHKAGAAMAATNGSIPVSKVAEAAHATVRTLERNFKQSSGYTVKDVSALMRFEQVRNSLWLEPDINLAGLAHEFGYTDQSHLSREFKRYSGTTPAAFARKAKKDKRELGIDFVAFIQA